MIDLANANSPLSKIEEKLLEVGTPKIKLDEALCDLPAQEHNTNRFVDGDLVVDGSMVYFARESTVRVQAVVLDELLAAGDPVYGREIGAVSLCFLELHHVGPGVL